MAVVIRDKDLLRRIERVRQQRKDTTATRTARHLLIERLVQIESLRVAKAAS